VACDICFSEGENMTDINKMVAFNKDQVRHINLVQQMVSNFAYAVQSAALAHDESKFSDEEYLAFVDSRDSLNASKDGTDEEYQKNVKGASIQAHINNNPHHPEYWDRVGKPMPLKDIIVMFFDWYSRSVQRGTGMDGFWQYNLEKLKNQPHAIPVVEILRREIAGEP
jgi:hypothetical protein